MERLLEQHGWGTGPAYILSGYLGVHPTYAQHLLSSRRYTIPEVTAVLSSLHRSGKSHKFDLDALDAAISSRHQASGARPSSLSPPACANLDWNHRPVLVLGRGPSTVRHAAALAEYVRLAAPIVLECNFVPELPAAPDHFSCFVLLANAEAQVDAALATGRGALLGVAGEPDSYAPAADSIARIRYRVKKGAVGINAEELVIPFDVVSMFAITLALRFGARRIQLAGFDGYPGSTNGRDLRMQSELVRFFELLARSFPELTLESLLPTSFPVAQRALYWRLAELHARTPGAAGH